MPDQVINIRYIFVYSKTLIKVGILEFALNEQRTFLSIFGIFRINFVRFIELSERHLMYNELIHQHLIIHLRDHDLFNSNLEIT